MESLLNPVHMMLLSLVSQLATSYQQENFQALLASLLSQDDKTLQANHWKSASALSRFLSQSRWDLGPLILTIRAFLLTQLLQPRGPGRPPELHIMVDLTSLEKTGKFKQFRSWLHYFHGCFGLHLVVVYLCYGRQRLPWSLAIYRGKGTMTPAQLALHLIRQLPESLRWRFSMRVLADGGFASKEFLSGLKRLGLPALVGCGRDRCLEDGRQLHQLHRRGQQVYLRDLPFPVWVSWFYQKQADGTYRRRFLLSTRRLSAGYMKRLGARRWAIEAFFKTMKQHFAVARFGMRRLKAVLRWFFFCWLAYLLSHWVCLAQGIEVLPDWHQAAQEAAEIFFYSLLLSWHEREVQRLRAKRQSLPEFDLSFLEVP